MDRWWRLGMGLLTVVTLSWVGCSGSTTSPQPLLEGVVLWPDGTDASELEGGTIEFEKEGTVAAKAQVISDGTFTVADGLPPGKYRVRILPPAKATVLDTRFQSFDKSELVVTATAEPQFVKLWVKRR